MSFLLCAVLGLIDAPVTDVTVFTDRARVRRTALVVSTGVTRVEFPTLPQSVEVESIRVESTNAEIKRVDIERVSPQSMQTDEAKRQLDDLERLDADIDRLNRERSAMIAHQNAFKRLVPVAAVGEPFKPVPRLNSSGWSKASRFASEQLATLQPKLRSAEAKARVLSEQRARQVEALRKLGQLDPTPGFRVVAEISGSASAALQLSYVVRNARWTPTWDVQFDPSSSTVALLLSGVVSQTTSEDWRSTNMTLSTAVPFSASQAPKLLTWKIGVSDRFIPTPTPVNPSIRPPPSWQRPAPASKMFEQTVSRLRAIEDVAFVPNEALDTEIEDPLEAGGLGLTGVGSGGGGVAVSEPAVNDSQPMSVPSPVLAAAPRAEYNFQKLESVAEATVADKKRVPVSTFSLSPPPSWQPPRFGADSPVTLAGGYALTFASLQKETIANSEAAHRVPLWSTNWPASVERSLYPALSTEAYLVARVKNPSTQVLPAGPAQLSVGADVVGVATLPLVAPQEWVTLPLGIDRGVKSVRNVQLLQSTQGVLMKDDVSRYNVTVEVVNSYQSPISVRVFDQFPVSQTERIETQLLESKPVATQQAKQGALEWRATLAPLQKQTFSFAYTVKRPKDWKLQQSEVSR